MILQNDDDDETDPINFLFLKTLPNSFSGETVVAKMSSGLDVGNGN